MTPAQRLRTVAELGKVRAVWGGYASVFIHGCALMVEQGKADQACLLLAGRLHTVEWMLRDPVLAVPHGNKLRAEALCYSLALEVVDGVGKGAA